MFQIFIKPRFCDTDALGHINNTVPPVWFLEAREDVLRVINPGLNAQNIAVVLVKVEIEYLKETYYGSPVEIRSWIEKVGSSSIDIYHEGWQDQQMKLRARARLVNFDREARTSKPLSDEIRARLSEHLKAD